MHTGICRCTAIEAVYLLSGCQCAGVAVLEPRHVDEIGAVQPPVRVQVQHLEQTLLHVVGHPQSHEESPEVGSLNLSEQADRGLSVPERIPLQPQL